MLPTRQSCPEWCTLVVHNKGEQGPVGTGLGEPASPCPWIKSSTCEVEVVAPTSGGWVQFVPEKSFVTGVVHFSLNPMADGSAAPRLSRKL